MAEQLFMRTTTLPFITCVQLHFNNAECGLKEYHIHNLEMPRFTCFTVCNSCVSLTTFGLASITAETGLKEYHIHNLEVQQVRGDPRSLSDMRRLIDVQRYKAAIVVCGKQLPW